MIIVTLLILLGITMLGMATMDSTGLEMRMATNSRSHQQAFEAAEYTLSWVENDILSNGGFTDASLTNTACGSICFEATCTNGYCFDGSNPTDWTTCSWNNPAAEAYESAGLWQDASGFHRTLNINAASVTAKYIIEFRCYTALDETQAISITNNTKMFRITAFITDQNGRSRVMLRSTIKES